MLHEDVPSAPQLQVVNLCKSYGRFPALSDVSFSVRQGEVLGVIGPNGAGKTTLFECLARVLPINSGAVHYDGRRLEPAQIATTLFYLPDGIAPWPAETVSWALDFAIGFFGGTAI